jgi:uncharacterized protein YbbC (DUF1343 family)
MSPRSQIKTIQKRTFSGIPPLIFVLSLLLSFGYSCGKSISENKKVELGNENFVEDFPERLENKSLGLVINHTSFLPGGKSLVRALLDKGKKIQAIFSPEHGYSGDFEAGMEIKNSQLEGIQIFSLYGKTRKPSPEMCQNIDAFVYDIQDVGTRFYTYISTLKYILEAAAEAKIPVYILDRPNPSGGKIIEGPRLQREYESFIGSVPIPVRYGLTPGELALMMKGQGWAPKEVSLYIIKMRNWKRKFLWKDTGLTWIPTSPNIPTPDTAIIYSGTGLLGALNLNEGRGTSHPFLQFGSPWLNPKKIISDLQNGIGFGIRLEAVNYIPRSIPQKALHPLYENKSCLGIRIHIIRGKELHSLRLALAFIKVLKESYGNKLTYHSHYLNQMFGNNLLSLFLEDRIKYEELLAQIKKEEIVFQKMREKYLLYK